MTAYTSGVCPNTIGPTIGQFCIEDGNNAWNEWSAGTPERFRSLPRYDESPTPPAKIVRARPDTTWLARNVITRNAWIDAIAAPLTAAITIAAISVPATPRWMRWSAQNPATAPISIIPWTPRFSTPERSVSNSPSAPKRSGVPYAIPLAIRTMSSELFMTPPRRQRGVRTTRTRWRTSSSPPSVQNRMIPWMTPTRPDGEARPLQGVAGVVEAADQERDEQAGERVVAGKRRDDDARVAVGLALKPVRVAVERMGEVADLARAAEPGDRTGDRHDREDLPPRPHARVARGAL